MFAPRGWLKRPGARRIYRAIERSGQFNSQWYRSTQLLASARWSDPLWHYLDHGAAQGLDPSPTFDTSHYVEKNADVRKSGINPLFHYIEYGYSERRSPVRSVQQTFDTLYPDARELQTFLSPLIGPPRLTVVLDQGTRTRSDYQLTKLLKACLIFASGHSLRVRIISSLADDQLLRSEITSAIQSAKYDPAELDLVTTSQSETPSTFEIHANEIFVATSWTSALALRHTAPEAGLRIIGPSHKSDASPTLEPYQAMAIEKWGLALAQGGPRERRALDSGSSSAPWIPRNTNPIHVTLFASAGNNPYEYLHALRVLEELLLRNPSLGAKISLSLVGEGIEPVALAEKVIPAVSASGTQGLANLVDLAIFATPYRAWAQKLIHQGVSVLDGTHGGLTDPADDQSAQVLSAESLESALTPLLAVSIEVAA